MKILMRSEETKKWKMLKSIEYSNEAELQELLAESPSLFTLDELRDENSVLVAAVREFGLPGSGSTDILAFSANGDIAIVECKLAANAEVKRKVVAQILEYGAFLWGMSYEDLNHRVKAHTGESLTDFVRGKSAITEWDKESFRSKIRDTLKMGRFALIIAVDKMNDELTRTIRFLNSCGNPAFTFAALEMNLFQEEKTMALVPKVYGGEASGPPPPPPPIWDYETFFEEIDNKYSIEIKQIYKSIYEWTKKKAHSIGWGRGEKTGSFMFYFHRSGRTVSVFSTHTSGLIQMRYGKLAEVMSPDDLAKFKKKITSIPSFESLINNAQEYPNIPITKAFVDHPDNLKRFIKVIEELIDNEAMTSSR